MDLFGIFRRRPQPILNVAELADFIDSQAAFVAQKGIYEYARARAGHYAKVMFKEPEFLAACDISRWQTFPLALAMVGELVEGKLLPAWSGSRMALNEAVRRVVLSVYDRYPAPPMLTAATWTAQRGDLDRHLMQASLHPPKFAKDIAEPFFQRYFDLMPIHEDLRTQDAPTTRGFLAVTLINIHDELSRRIDLPAIAAELEGGAGAAPPR